MQNDRGGREVEIGVLLDGAKTSIGLDQLLVCDRDPTRKSWDAIKAD